MAHDDGARCLCVAEHRPPVLEPVEHHVWPSYLGGPDVASNLIWICPTTHYNVHEVLRAMVKAGVVLPRAIGQPRYAYELALRGFGDWLASTA